MPLPVPSPIISSTAVDGIFMADDLFPRVKLRRIVLPQEPFDRAYFEKRGAEHLDYAADLTPVLEKSEMILAAYAWTSAASELKITSVRFASKAVLAFVFGGMDRTEYELSFLVKTSTGRIIECQAMITVYQSAAEARLDYTPPIIGTDADPATSYITDAMGVFLVPSYIGVNAPDIATSYLMDVMGVFLPPPYTDATGGLLFVVPG